MENYNLLVLVHLAVVVAEEGQVEAIWRELHAALATLQLWNRLIRPVGHSVEDHAARRLRLVGSRSRLCYPADKLALHLGLVVDIVEVDKGDGLVQGEAATGLAV